MSVFRYLDRWQGSIRDRWARPDQTEDLLAILDQRDRQLETFLETHAARTKWIAPTFENGWVDFGGANPGAAYRRVGDEVQLRGVIKSGTVGVVPAFTMPADYRPLAGTLNVFFPALSAGALGMVVVSAAGEVQVQVGTNTDVSMTGMSFSVST